MTRPHRIALAVACAMLAACSGGDAGNDSAGKEGAGGDNASNATVAPARPVPIPRPAPTPSPQPVAELPTTMRGRWALTDADCDPTRADAKGLMTVGATTLAFYEARATIDVASRSAPDRISAQLNFTGEGQRWSRREALTLLDEGRTLLREEQSPPGAFRYSRCPD